MSGLTTSFAIVPAAALRLRGRGHGATGRRDRKHRERRAADPFHRFPGTRGARGVVGPPLDHVSRRKIIAGVMENAPASMITWLRAPQQVVPGNAMSDMGLSEAQARDVTVCLHALD